jgi:hypothetical protein
MSIAGTAGARPPSILREVTFTKTQLLRLSKAELELILRLGLAVNELMLFQRFVGLITNSRPRASAAQDIWLSQLISALMCSTGKVFEALQVFHRHFLATPLGRDLIPHLPAEAQTAIDTLTRLRGRNSLLADVRNLYSFHFHNDADLSPFLEHLDADAPLSLYYGLCDANVVHHFAVEPLVTSLMKTTGADDGEGAIVRIVGEIQRATQAFHQFVRAIGEALFAKIGRLQVKEHVIDSSDVGVIDEQRFPTLITPAPRADT